MATEQTPVDIEVTFRHVDSERRARGYALKKLSGPIYSLPNLRSALVEIDLEHTRPADQRYKVQVTLVTNGSLLRVEDRGRYANLAIDRVHDLLERRLRNWKGKVYFERRRQRAAYEEKAIAQMEAARLLPEDRTSLIVRRKSHEMKPMFPEDAVEQMELLGHDFFLFINAETCQYNVLYHRKDGGYGLIEPTIKGVVPPQMTGSIEETPGTASSAK
jgi:ribosome-associated translation inhibitor RaiA